MATQRPSASASIDAKGPVRADVIGTLGTRCPPATLQAAGRRKVAGRIVAAGNAETSRSMDVR
jgi:hypothetical protein